MNRRKYKTYCGNSTDKQNYIEYLNSALQKTEKEKEIWNRFKNKPYTDPDTSHNNEHSLFYINLERYLNKKFYKMFCEFHSNNNPTGLSIINSNIVLRSDQFGFSAPHNSYAWNKNKYPYAKYLNKTNDSKKIADIIWKTRTLGGSFLWPIVYCKSDGKYCSVYNKTRGICSYIEDRVDLTLLEIKDFYEIFLNKYDYPRIKEKMNENGYIILKSQNNHGTEDDDSKKVYDWLKCFKDFPDYVEKMSLQDFVDNNYDIYNLMKKNSTFHKDDNINIHRENNIREIRKLDLNKKEDFNKLSIYFKNLIEKTLKRTEKMERIINGETNKK